jgi:hypothetical protein
MFLSRCYRQACRLLLLCVWCRAAQLALRRVESATRRGCCCLVNLLLSNPTQNPRLFDSVFPSGPSAGVCALWQRCVCLCSRLVHVLSCVVYMLPRGAQSADCCVPCQHRMWAVPAAHILCASDNRGCSASGEGRQSVGSLGRSLCCLRLSLQSFRRRLYYWLRAAVCVYSVAQCVYTVCVRFGWCSLISPLAFLHVAFFSPASTIVSSHTKRCHPRLGREAH